MTYLGVHPHIKLFEESYQKGVKRDIRSMKPYGKMSSTTRWPWRMVYRDSMEQRSRCIPIADDFILVECLGVVGCPAETDPAGTDHRCRWGAKVGRWVGGWALQSLPTD